MQESYDMTFMACPMCVYIDLLICCLCAESEDDKFFSLPLLSPVNFSRQDAKVDALTNHNDTFSLQPLLDELGDRWQFSWIKQRMEIMWPEIHLAGRYVTNMSCSQWTGPRLRVFINLFTFTVISYSALFLIIETVCKEVKI